MAPRDLIRHLEVLRAKQLRLIADQDPTLTRLKQALATERVVYLQPAAHAATGQTE